LSFYLTLLISLISHMHSSNGFC